MASPLRRAFSTAYPGCPGRGNPPFVWIRLNLRCRSLSTTSRRWLAVIALLFVAMVAGTYFYARVRLRNVLNEIPNKIGIDIKQTANGFQFSKSDGKRTLFTVQASKLKQFKLDGSAELHNVSIVLYGRDSSRFDQIYGDDFSYDKKTGTVTGHGEVQIDLEANPTGVTGPDQGTPRELKNPIHLETRDLVFNQESGDATTNARVDFPYAASHWVGRRSAVFREDKHTYAGIADSHDDGRGRTPKAFSPRMAESLTSRMKSCWSIPECTAKAE